MEETIVDPTHSFSVDEAIRYGSVEKALIVKEIRGMQVYKQRNGKPGWVYYSAKALTSKFPYMKRASIDRWLRELVESGELESSVRNATRYDKTKSYRLPRLAQNEPSDDYNDLSGPTGEQPIPPHSPSHSPSQPRRPADDRRSADRPDTPDPIKKAFEDLNKTLGGSDRTLASAGRLTKLKRRLTKFPLSDLLQAAEAIAANPFMMGDNPNGRRYGNIDYLLRNDETIDRWLDTAAPQREVVEFQI